MQINELYKLLGITKENLRYQNEEWETLLAAMETVQESWATVYVNPEAAHMDGSN